MINYFMNMVISLLNYIKHHLG